MGDDTNNRYDLTTLFHKRIVIPGGRPPITELALAAERAENMRRHKVYSTDRSKNWNPFILKKHPERSTGDAKRVEEARRSNEETTV